VHQHAIDRDVEDAEIVCAVIVSDLPDVCVREPALNQLGMPSRGLIEVSVLAILDLDTNASVRTLRIAEHIDSLPKVFACLIQGLQSPASLG